VVLVLAELWMECGFQLELVKMVTNWTWSGVHLLSFLAHNIHCYTAKFKMLDFWSSQNLLVQVVLCYTPSKCGVFSISRLWQNALNSFEIKNFTGTNSRGPKLWVWKKCSADFVISLQFVWFTSILNPIILNIILFVISIPSSVGVVRGYRLDGWEIGVRFLAGIRNFYLLHRIHTCVGPTQSPIQWILGGGSFPRVKAARAWSWWMTHLHLVPMSRMVQPYLHSPICLHAVVLQ
jgi:hypothetical protein